MVVFFCTKEEGCLLVGITQNKTPRPSSHLGQRVKSAYIVKSTGHGYRH